MSSQTGFRVIHVFPNSARLSCGPCNGIMSFMESQLQHGLDVRAVSPADNQIPASRCNSIEHLPIKEFDLAAEDFCSKTLAEAGGARNIFHFHGISPWSDRLAKSLKQVALPYVFTSHGQLHYHGMIHGFKKFVYLNFVSPFIREAGGLHFLTGRERERFKFLLPSWHKPALIQPYPIPLPDVTTIEPMPRATFDIPADAFVFGFLGRLDVQHKGLDLLLEAFARIAGQSKVCLILIGPDFKGGRQFLERRARELGCEGQVRFLGSQVGAAKWSILKMADAFVFPSRWEAFGIALAETAGIGIPTIASDKFNTAAEMALHRAALTSPLSSAALAKAMLRVRDDKALRRSLSESGCRWVNEICSNQRAGALFEEFYQSVLLNSRAEIHCA